MALNRKLVLLSLLIGAILITIPTAEAALRTTIADGDWTMLESWSGGLPGPGDDIIISHKINMDID